MQLVHNNVFHFLYYNSIIHFFDSMNMTTTHQNNHPTPNLNLVMKCNSGPTGALIDLEQILSHLCVPLTLRQLWPLTWTDFCSLVLGREPFSSRSQASWKSGNVRGTVGHLQGLQSLGTTEEFQHVHLQRVKVSADDH